MRTAVTDTSIDAYHSRSRRTAGQLQCDRIAEYVALQAERTRQPGLVLESCA
ncbi:hypothetical protein R77569_04531 [Ralstonia mannitolilytica]|uniref:Transposase n=1 Tax=Ralstonia mannitolilytica TaxID=105219 RepID=A0ABN9KH92_9RALS|nr:hypothetical protein [Ralstonia mannitolilytica]CAJ0895779.1 hypothetical protein R77569_04531 [Ralstonia mannitolilytica]